MTVRWKGSHVFEALMFRDAKKLFFGNSKDAQFNWNGSYMEGPNPNSGFWTAFPTEAYADPSLAYFFFDDFLAVPYGDVAAPWTLDGVGTPTFLPGAGQTVGLGGVAILTAVSTANNYGQVKLSSTDVDAGPFKITKDSGKKLWFEARVKIVDTAANVFYIGLADALNTQMGANTTGARNMVSGVYFRGLAASPTEIDTAVCAVSTETEVKSNGGTQAGAWMTFGIYFDGVNTVTFYLNGTALTDTVAADATNFPNSVALTPVFFLLTGASANKTMHLDWIKIAQLR